MVPEAGLGGRLRGIGSSPHESPVCLRLHELICFLRIRHGTERAFVLCEPHFQVVSLFTTRPWTGVAYTPSSAGGLTSDRNPQHSDRSHFWAWSHGSQICSTERGGISLTCSLWSPPSRCASSTPHPARWKMSNTLALWTGVGTEFEQGSSDGRTRRVGEYKDGRWEGPEWF